MDCQSSLVYRDFVRRGLLSLLIAFALVAGGLASAGTAFACPMQTPAAAHDCCPDQAPAQDDDSKGDCPYMQACRAAPSVLPVVGVVSAPTKFAVAFAPPLSDGVFADAAPAGLFRPPRTL